MIVATAAGELLYKSTANSVVLEIRTAREAHPDRGSDNTTKVKEKGVKLRWRTSSVLINLVDFV